MQRSVGRTTDQLYLDIESELNYDYFIDNCSIAYLCINEDNLTKLFGHGNICTIKQMEEFLDIGNLMKLSATKNKN